MNDSSELFPTYNKFARKASHFFHHAPVPVRIALLPTLIVIGAFPLALFAALTRTHIAPQASTPAYRPQVQNIQPAKLPSCIIAGCSRELCVDPQSHPDVSDCAWKDAYACYADAGCQRQADGQCGWTQTPQLTQCLEAAQLSTLTPNVPPQITTSSLPTARIGEIYLTNIVAKDTDLADTLSLSLVNLPSGINLDLCRPTQTIGGNRVVSCQISGLPTGPTGTFSFTATATDNHNHTTSTTLSLTITP